MLSFHEFNINTVYRQLQQINNLIMEIIIGWLCRLCSYSLHICVTIHIFISSCTHVGTVDPKFNMQQNIRYKDRRLDKGLYNLCKQVDELPSKNQALCAFCVTCIVLLCVNLLYSLCKLNHC